MNESYELILLSKSETYSAASVDVLYSPANEVARMRQFFLMNQSHKAQPM